MKPDPRFLARAVAAAAAHTEIAAHHVAANLAGRHTLDPALGSSLEAI
jgi:hypothetical protein